MEQSRIAGVTPKAEATRQRILDTALNLFVTKGYEGTTMRDIAAEAGCSLGLTYRYFARKEDLVLVLYHRLAEELEEQVRTLPRASLAERFYRAMLAQLTLLAPYRELSGPMFGSALNPQSGVGVFGESTADVRRQVENVFAMVVTRATDAPRKSQAGHLATVLYGAHLALVLFWLLDRSPDTRATYELLAFTRDMLAMVRPILVLPPIVKALARLARIIGPVLGYGSEVA